MKEMILLQLFFFSVLKVIVSKIVHTVTCLILIRLQNLMAGRENDRQFLMLFCFQDSKIIVSKLVHNMTCLILIRLQNLMVGRKNDNSSCFFVFKIRKSLCQISTHYDMSYSD